MTARVHAQNAQTGKNLPITRNLRTHPACGEPMIGHGLGDIFGEIPGYALTHRNVQGRVARPGVDLRTEAHPPRASAGGRVGNQGTSPVLAAACRARAAGSALVTSVPIGGATTEGFEALPSSTSMGSAWSRRRTARGHRRLLRGRRRRGLRAHGRPRVGRRASGLAQSNTRRVAMILSKTSEAFSTTSPTGYDGLHFPLVGADLVPMGLSSDSLQISPAQILAWETATVAHQARGAGLAESPRHRRRSRGKAVASRGAVESTITRRRRCRRRDRDRTARRELSRAGH